MRLNTIDIGITRRRDRRVSAHVKLIGFNPVRLQELANLLASLSDTTTLYGPSKQTVHVAKRIGHQLSLSLEPPHVRDESQAV